ncbi:MBL fold metallo-hydrolase [Alteribacillus sp. HJP-4]|uniref:MBL fold metallo-hydrolase n=1 Tax=Alteribacillus sp. HJP-4 TaxID=2775394 RepID=UPI0035CCFF66
MQWKKPTYLHHNIWISDGFDLELANRTGTYIINEQDLTIVETGPSPSAARIKKSLDHLNRRTEEVKHIIVTHIHLDHAGGAGLFLKDCPNASVHAHPKAARHLNDPQRLIQGAKAVYGDKFDKLFEPIIPIPENKITIQEDESVLTLSSGRTLTFIDTPGHANHHHSIFDSESRGIFSGDTIGIQYADAAAWNKELYLPSTSPNQFNPDQMLDSLRRIEKLEPSYVYFGHYGETTNVIELKKQLQHWLAVFLEEGRRIFQQNGDYLQLAEILENRVLREKQLEAVPEEDPLRRIIKLDMEVSSMGIIDYLKKHSSSK